MGRMAKAVTICLAGLLLSACGASSSYTYAMQDVTDLVEEADALMGDHQYSQAADLYLQAMEREPKEMDARLGLAKAQTALGDYEGAADALELAMLIDPRYEGAIEQYAALSRASGDATYAARATSLAKRYGLSDFMTELPEAPRASVAGGPYDSEQAVELTSSYERAVIWYRVRNDERGIASDFRRYQGSIALGRGITTLEAYAVVDGVASQTSSNTYRLLWKARPVEFVDEGMEEVVRTALNEPSRQLTEDDLAKVEQISTVSSHAANAKGTPKIMSLEDVTKLPNLRVMHIYEQQVDDLAPLESLAYLSDLTWSHGSLQNLDFLEGLPGLATLDVSYNEIDDIGGIEHCPGLASVALQGNIVSDLSALYGCDELESLSIDDANVSTASDLSNLSDLRIWGFNFDRHALSRLTNLTSLQILTDSFVETPDGYEPSLSDLSCLESLSGLRNVTLYCVNDRDELAHLHLLSGLRNLTLSYSGASGDVEAIEALREALPNCSIR